MMARTVVEPYTEEEIMLDIEELPALVTRIEKALRPLGGKSYGPDHDRVRALYANLVRTCTGDPLERARRAVLYDILSPVLHTGGVEKRYT